VGLENDGRYGSISVLEGKYGSVGRFCFLMDSFKRQRRQKNLCALVKGSGDGKAGSTASMAPRRSLE
jgi:hypothetical protein